MIQLRRRITPGIIRPICLPEPGEIIRSHINDNVCFNSRSFTMHSTKTISHDTCVEHKEYALEEYPYSITLKRFASFIVQYWYDMIWFYLIWYVSHTLPFSHSSILTLFQSCTLPISHSSNPTYFQSHTLPKLSQPKQGLTDLRLQYMEFGDILTFGHFVVRVRPDKAQ